MSRDRHRGTLPVDLKWMHRVVAGERQPGYHRLRGRRRGDAARRQGVSHDAVVGLGIDVVLVDRDAGSARVAIRLGWAEADHVVRLTVALGALKCDQEAARRGRVVVVVPATPGVDIDHAIRRHREVPGMTELVGENGGAEPRRERDAAIVVRAGRGLRMRRDCGGEQERRGESGGGNERGQSSGHLLRVHQCKLLGRRDDSSNAAMAPRGAKGPRQSQSCARRIDGLI